MTATPTAIPTAPLRVLVADGGRPASMALAEWLREQTGLEIQGPISPLTATIAFATKYRPHVVLLDFHGLPVSVGYVVTLLKELAPSPAVFVLTHETSAAMRRRCREVGVDAVFDKTTELESLVQALAALSGRGASEGSSTP